MKTRTKECQVCYDEFTCKRIDAKYCSGACKQQAFIARRIEEIRKKGYVWNKQKRDFDYIGPQANF